MELNMVKKQGIVFKLQTPRKIGGWFDVPPNVCFALCLAPGQLVEIYKTFVFL